MFMCKRVPALPRFGWNLILLGMSTLTEDACATKVWFDQERFWLLLEDGRQLGVPLTYSPRLANAHPDQLANVKLSGSGRALHWDDLDEDLSVEGFLLGHPVR